jgi:mRNA-degrading endonuclease RelE of RelBE toxin-antitoxin system
MYVVTIKRKIEKRLESLPARIQDAFFELVEDLRESGPVQPSWPNYSRLTGDEYHCHLSYHYVSCWRHQKGQITIEVYYVGSREKAPY